MDKNLSVKLIKKDLLRARKNETETETEGNVKTLFILTPDTSLFNMISNEYDMKIP